MRTIYEPAGRAREYAALAANPYTGCTHGCWYCFNRAMPFYDDAVYSSCKPRTGFVDELIKSAEKLGKAHCAEEILLCFGCDPYPADRETTMTRCVLRILEVNRLNCTVLTKGGTRACRDFDLLLRNNWRFGSSLGLHTETLREFWEPRAAGFADRREAILDAHSRGIRTWVSIEPVIDAREALQCIEWTRGLVDHYKLGRTNHLELIRKHDATWKEPNWKRYLTDALALIGGDASYFIKRDLAQAAGWEGPREG